MTIQVYVFSKSTQSTGRPTNADTNERITVTLKEPCDVLNPTFILTGSNWDGYGYNYIVAVLGDKERYYRVTGVRYLHNNVREISCTEDVLATWRTNILASSQFILRCSDSSLYDTGINMLISDSAYPSIVSEAKDPSVLSAWDSENGYYVLGIIGDNIYTNIERGPVKYIVMTKAQLENLITILNGLTLQAADQNPLQYIVSCTYIPVTFYASDFNSHQSSWTLGSYTLTAQSYYSHDGLAADGIDILINNDITIDDHSLYASRGRIMNYSPWTSYHLYAGPFGDFDIPPEKVKYDTGREINIQVYLDVCTGMGRLSVNSPGDPIIVIDRQLGVPVMLSQITSNSVAGTYETYSHLAASLGSAVAFDFGASVSQMGAAVMNSYLNSIPKLDSSGSNGSMASIYDSFITLMRYERWPTADDTAHIGRPVMQNFALSTINSGSFVKCRNAVIAINAYLSEINEIESALNNGIYLD